MENNKKQLNDYLLDLCGEDFMHPDKNRILSLNMVKAPYAVLWVRLYRTSLEVIFSTKIADGLGENQRYNMEERKRLNDPYSPNGEFSLLRAGDIETSGRNRNVKSFEKALYYIQKQLLLYIQNDDKEKIRGMVLKALEYIQKERAVLNPQLSNYFFTKIMEDMVDGSEYISFCEDLSKFENRLFDKNVRERDNLEKVFYSLFNVQNKYRDLSFKQIYDMVYTDKTPASMNYVDPKTIREEFYKVFLSEDTEKKMSGFRKIIYTLLVGISVCTMKGKEKNEILNEFISYFSGQPVSEAKNSRKRFIMKTPVPVDVYMNEALSKNLICKINPAVNSFAEFELNDSSPVTKLIVLSESFAKTFELTKSTDFDLEEYLTDEEITSCYNREQALLYLESPSSRNSTKDNYYLKQLRYVGKEEDLAAVSKYLTINKGDNQWYIIVQVMRCMIALSIKYDNTSYSSMIRTYAEACPKDFVLHSVIQKEYDEYKQFLQKEHKMVKCTLMIISPISTDVYLNNKNNLLMRIDKNQFNERSICRIELNSDPNDNVLIFSAHNLEKTFRIHGEEGERVGVNLNNWLSKKEIISTYNLEDVYAHKDNLTFFSLEQLSHIGTKKEIELLKTAIDQIQSKNSDHRIPKMFESLCRIIERLDATEYISYVKDLYKDNFINKNIPIIEEAKDAFENKMNILLM